MTQEAVPSTTTKWTPRRVMQATLVVSVIVGAFWLLYRFQTVILALFIAILIGTAIKPAVRWLEGRGLPRIYGEILVYILLFTAIIGFLLLALPLVLEQSTVIVQQLSGFYESFRKFMLNSGSYIFHQLGFRLPAQFQVEQLVQNPPPATATPPPTQTAPAAPGSAIPPADLVAQAMNYATLLVRGIFMVVAIFLMSFYWTLEGDRAIRSLLLLVPTARRDNVRDIFDAVEAKLGGFLLGEGILCATISAFSLISFLLIGLPNAFVLALIAGVMELVPTIGPALGALPAIIIASSIGVNKVILVLISATLIQFLENNLLVPRIMDKSVGVNPLITLLSLAAFSSLFGLIGALLAVPLAAIIQLLMNRLVINRDESAEIKPEGRDYVSYLRLQAQEISRDTRRRVRNNEQEPEKVMDQVEDSIEAVADDLDRILSQATVQEGNVL